MTYDDGMVSQVWDAIYDRLLAMKDGDIAAGLGFQLQDGNEPGFAVARAAIAAVIEGLPASEKEVMALKVFRSAHRRIAAMLDEAAENPDITSLSAAMALRLLAQTLRETLDEMAPA